MTTRRKLLQASSGAAALLAHRLALSQGQGRKVAVVGMLTIANLQRLSQQLDAFMQGMRDLGWVDGQNVDFRIVSGEGDAQRLDVLAAELVAQKVDVIAAGDAAATRAAQRATTSIPIVMGYVPNAVGSGFVASLAKPGGNITGITTQHEESIAKLIEVLHESVPHARRFAVLLSEFNPSSVSWWAGAQRTCAALGLEPLRVGASSPAQLEGAVAEMVAKRAEAVVIVGDAMQLSERVRLLGFLRPTRLPVGGGFADFATAGALLSFGADSLHTIRHAASFVDKILKGAKPADLPVEQPTKFQLVLNLATAKSLGLTIPRTR